MPLLPGDPAPFFRVASSVNPDFYFDTVAGRYVILSFIASSRLPYSKALLEEVEKQRERFDGFNAAFLAVTVDPEDRTGLTAQWPGIVYLWDNDLAVTRLYGAIESKSTSAHDAQQIAGEANASKGGDGAAINDESANPITLATRTLVLDQALRVIAILAFEGEPAAHLEAALRIIDNLPKVQTLRTPAPVLHVPYVFESELCKALVGYYESHGGDDSGFMREENGKTVGVMDYSHKRRRDCEIRDQNLIRATRERLARRVIPAIERAFAFHATRIERHIVACYDATDGGHFSAHRDNTTPGTAHRRFAVTINLNADEYEGGDLWFPEFSRRAYRPPTGGAIVFCCSLLHEATRVTKGRRYAFLPFLYDDAAARIRDQNRGNLASAPQTPASELP